MYPNAVWAVFLCSNLNCLFVLHNCGCLHWLKENVRCVNGVFHKHSTIAAYILLKMSVQSTNPLKKTAIVERLWIGHFLSIEYAHKLSVSPVPLTYVLSDGPTRTHVHTHRTWIHSSTYRKRIHTHTHSLIIWNKVKPNKRVRFFHIYCFSLMLCQVPNSVVCKQNTQLTSHQLMYHLLWQTGRLSFNISV